MIVDCRRELRRHETTLNGGLQLSSFSQQFNRIERHGRWRHLAMQIIIIYIELYTINAGAIGIAP